MSSGRAISKDVNGVFKLVSIQFPPIVADDTFLSIRPTAAEDETKKKGATKSRNTKDEI